MLAGIHLPGQGPPHDDDRMPTAGYTAHPCPGPVPQVVLYDFVGAAKAWQQHLAEMFGFIFVVDCADPDSVEGEGSPVVPLGMAGALFCGGGWSPTYPPSNAFGLIEFSNCALVQRRASQTLGLRSFTKNNCTGAEILVLRTHFQFVSVPAVHWLSAREAAQNNIFKHPPPQSLSRFQVGPLPTAQRVRAAFSVTHRRRSRPSCGTRTSTASRCWSSPTSRCEQLGRFFFFGP